MRQRNWIPIAIRIGVFVVMVVLFCLWARHRASSAVSDGPVSGFQWQQRHPRASRPTPNVAPRPTADLGSEEAPSNEPTLQTPNDVITEAFAQVGAAEYHREGYRGQGVRVAIIDTGFDGVADAVTRGELPNTLITRRFVPNRRVSGRLREGNSAHGTACAEIVHDLAPDAQLYLIQVESFVQTMAEVFEYLSEEQVQIVSMSLAVLAPGRGDGQGVAGDPPVPIYSILQNAATHSGMLIVTSAGNYARQHYHGFFTDADGDGYHDFKRPAPDEGFDSAITVNAARGERFSVYLSWDDWGTDPLVPAAQSDYDLLLYGPDGSEIASSATRQTGDGPPVERVEAEAQQEGVYALRIFRKPDSAPGHALRLWVTGRDLPLLSHQVPQGSLAPPTDSEDVLTVGAAAINTHQLLPVSSRGPTTDGRIKPDLVSYTCVSVSQPEYGPGGFSGTSAAAPHVAGMAALLASGGVANPAHVRATLIASAADYGLAGPDAAWGHGLASLPPLSVSLVLTPLVGLPITLDPSGFLTVEVSVRRGDGTPIGGLRPDDFQISLNGQAGEVVSLQDQRSSTILHVRKPPDLRASSMILSMEALGAVATLPGIRSGRSGEGHTAPSAPHMDVRIPQRTYQTGDLIPVTVAVYAATSISVTRVYAQVSGPDIAGDGLTLHDDGMSGDGVAGDGVYGGCYPLTPTQGNYRIQVLAFGMIGQEPFDVQRTIEANVEASGFDSDGDSLPDNWEAAMGLNYLINDFYRDLDGDGLSNLEEYRYGAHPQNWDTDGDGLSDYAEVTGYLPTSPYNRDTDLGGATDRWEVLSGTNPRDPRDDGGSRPGLRLPPRLRD